MAMQCAGNKALKGGPAIIHIRSDAFTKVDIKANVTGMDPRNEVAQASGTGTGFTVQERNSYIEFELEDGCDLSLASLGSVCNGTVVARLVNGKAYAFRDVWLATDDFSFGTEEGRITVRFESQYEAEEVLGC